MRKLIVAAVLAVALVVPVAATAIDSGPCGPDPAFGYRTTAGGVAARAVLIRLGYSDNIATGTGIDGNAVIGGATDAEEIILAGYGFFGDSVTHAYQVDYSAFSGIVGVTGSQPGDAYTQGDGLYAVKFGKIVGFEFGGPTTDTALLYEKYLGSAQPTLSGTPCPVVAVVPPAPVSTAVAPSVITRLRGYIANLVRCDCNPAKLELYWARLDLYLAR